MVTNNSTFRRVACFDSNDYEPYVVLKRDGHPADRLTLRYDERFTGYGKNKIEMIMRLREAGSTFRVLPGVFLVHVPHPLSAARLDWGERKQESNERLLTKVKHALAGSHAKKVRCLAVVQLPNSQTADRLLRCR